MTSSPVADLAQLEQLGRRARQASRLVARSSSATRDEALRRGADLLEQHTDEVLQANGVDLERAETAGAAGAKGGAAETATALDRLRLTPSRISGMASGLRQVADASRSGR